jgi:hypothetical protein
MKSTRMIADNVNQWKRAPTACAIAESCLEDAAASLGCGGIFTSEELAVHLNFAAGDSDKNGPPRAEYILGYIDGSIRPNNSDPIPVRASRTTSEPCDQVRRNSGCDNGLMALLWSR